MKKYLFLSIAILSLCAATSCSKSGAESPEDKVLHFDPKVEAAQSVTSILKCDFEVGDRISLFIWNGVDNSAPAVDEFALFNKQLSSYGTTWTAFADTTYLDSFASESIVAGVYPAQFASSTLLDAQSVNVGIESPTLYYREALSGYCDELLNPTFKNMQAQLSFNINGAAQVPNSISLKSNLVTSATLNLLSGELTIADAIYSSIVFGQNSVASNLYSSLMIPQTITNFTITSDDSTYEYTGDGITLSAGEILVQNITLTAPVVPGEIGDIELGESFDIIEWEASDEASGDFEFNE